MIKTIKKYAHAINTKTMPMRDRSKTYQYLRWHVRHSPPPPDSVKRNGLKHYAKKFSLKTFVETGTYKGGTPWALRHVFNELYSIELNEILFEKAKEKFANCPNVHLFQGDSGAVLPTILPQLQTPTLFYLDGHWCGDETSKGELYTPIKKELELVLRHNNKHVVIIDDARLFVGEYDYPTIDELRSFVKTIDPAWTLEVRNDFITIINSVAQR